MSKSITEEMVKDVIKEWARNKAENGRSYSMKHFAAVNSFVIKLIK